NSDQAFEPLDMPMFPLGSVLLPGMGLPLHVFEPRYRVMMYDLQQSNSQEFGVVLIERGSEVGGGDTRGQVGCRAAIAQAEEQPDGSWVGIAVGTERIKLLAWLPEDPYPRASVVPWPDQRTEQQLDDALIEGAERVARRVAALAVEMGAQGLLADAQLSEDPSSRLYELATMAPLGALDRSRLLCTPDLPTRFELLVAMLEEQELLLQARLTFGD
ncbi:MAG: LON peptidase substrate-binding domain-containing protein, partial [Actinobacteria bacterium]|nr:LON peptidase substrate-binding domain-containing protein [Actinomycetota bacterium]